MIIMMLMVKEIQFFDVSLTHGKRLSEENNDDDDDVKKCNLSRSLSPIGRGKMMVEFFSAAIPLKVWRYLRKT